MFELVYADFSYIHVHDERTLYLHWLMSVAVTIVSLSHSWHEESTLFSVESLDANGFSKAGARLQ